MSDGICLDKGLVLEYGREMLRFVEHLLKKQDIIAVNIVDTVFLQHDVEDIIVPFQSEEARLEWLLQKCRLLAEDYLYQINL